jgi:hypothetical protein
MQHPFITDLSNLSFEDLQEKIADLSKKINYAYKSQNSSLINQMLMVLDSYNAEYQKRIDDMYKKQNIQNTIQISNINNNTNL